MNECYIQGQIYRVERGDHLTVWSAPQLFSLFCLVVVLTAIVARSLLEKRLLTLTKSIKASGVQIKHSGNVSLY